MTKPKGTLNQNRHDGTMCENAGRHRLDALHSKDDCPTEIKAGRDEATRKEYAQIAHETYMRSLDRVVNRLMDLADRVKREGTPSQRVEGRALPSDGYPHSYAASQAIHELHWGIANAHLDTLVRDAAEADRAAREAQS